ncbi:MAG: LON peptidase substrate-binding domain-containing protein [Luteimonas sp.]
MTGTDSFPLFPLHTVLLPGAAIGLRVFEPRYLDLVRDCGRSGEGFGICLILSGAESGTTVRPAAFGTEARIEDFGTGDDGLLILRVRGRRRFHVQRTRVRDNGLVVAEIDWRDPDPDDELRPEHALLGLLLQRILEQVGGEHANAAPARFDDAAWIGWRLSELLPLADQHRQALLQEDDPHARLDQLLALLP